MKYPLAAMPLKIDSGSIAAGAGGVTAHIGGWFGPLPPATPRGYLPTMAYTRLPGGAAMFEWTPGTVAQWLVVAVAVIYLNRRASELQEGESASEL